MSRGAAVAHHNTIYCIPRGSNTVYCYQLDKDEWREYLQCPHSNPGLVIISELLTAIGGEKKFQKTNRLVSWNGTKWVEVFPPMETARYNQAVVSDDHYIIAAGGENNETSVPTLAPTSGPH